MGIVSSSPWIVYELCHPSGEPFYVGMGRPRRVKDHFQEWSLSDGTYKSRLLRKLLADGVCVNVRVVFETNDRTLALQEEQRLIARYRAAGLSLTNLTSGGDGGCFGTTQSLESRQKRSATTKGRPGRPLSDEAKEKIGAAFRGKKLSDEHKAKISAGLRGRECSPETREKIANAQRGKYIPPESRAKMSQAQQGKRQSPETRAKRSDTLKRKGHRPDEKCRSARWAAKREEAES